LSRTRLLQTGPSLIGIATAADGELNAITNAALISPRFVALNA
jgi:hypothetical protein